MSRLAIIHGAILAILVCITIIVYLNANAEKEAALKKSAETEYSEDGESGSILGTNESQAEASMMGKVAVPMILTVLYAGFLTIVYVMPYFVGRMTDEALGSTEEFVEDDPLRDARAAYAQGDYEGAAEIYRGVFQGNPTDRLPIVEVAKIQRENLNDSGGAVQTLKEALESRDWPENDAAFFMFRIADIFENDLENHDGAIEILKQVCEVMPETRHSANATHKLRELGAI